MPFENFRQDVHRWGLLKSSYVRIMRRLQRWLGFRLFVVHTRPLDPDPLQLALSAGCSVRILSEAELIEFSVDSALGLASDSIRRDNARGNLCFGYLEQAALVSYTWVATKATPAEGGLWIRFSEGYRYSYRALTVPSHRGRRLQLHIVHASDRWQAARGCRYNIDYIDTLNLPSIAADRRYGNRPVGYAGYAKWFGRMRLFRSPGVKAIGFEFFVPSPGEAE